MSNTDKVLVGIVAGIVLVIGIALTVTILRPEPTYQSEETPEGVVHNYLLALQLEDYEQAYRHLSPSLQGYPDTVEAFVDHVQDNSWRFRLTTDPTLTVESATILGSRATVTVRESSFRGGDLFDTGQSTRIFDMQVREENGAWKIVESTYYFAYCWERSKGCN